MKNDTTYESRPVCQTGAKILYAWAMDAPPLKLPPGEITHQTVGILFCQNMDGLPCTLHFKISKLVPKFSLTV